jgi:uracil-DNA glycosylase family 4
VKLKNRKLSNNKLLRDRHSISCQFRRPSKCIGCPAHPDSPAWDPLLYGAFIKPTIEKRAKFCVVGISGGEEEEAGGEALIGPSGRRLKRAIEMGAERKVIFSKFNLFNCRSLKLGMRGNIINRDPTAREIKECWKRWLGPFLKTNDQLIVPLGALAYRYIVEIPLEKETGMKVKMGHALGHRLMVPRRMWK